MSKHETLLTRSYWDEVGGTLVKEFPAVLRGSGNAQRLIDGVIILGEPKRIAKPSEVSINGKDIIVLQTKANPPRYESDGPSNSLQETNGEV